MFLLGVLRGSGEIEDERAMKSLDPLFATCTACATARAFQPQLKGYLKRFTGVEARRVGSTRHLLPPEGTPRTDKSGAGYPISNCSSIYDPLCASRNGGGQPEIEFKKKPTQSDRHIC